jgi:hypothetical protein
VKWKFITLDRIIMKCGWQVQGGGQGMGGGQTQTIPIPYKHFDDMNADSFEDAALEAKAELSTAVQAEARKMLGDTNSFCSGIFRNKLP